METAQYHAVDEAGHAVTVSVLESWHDMGHDKTALQQEVARGQHVCYSAYYLHS